MVRSIRWNGRTPFGTGTSWLRHDHARHQSSNTAIASFERGTEPGARHQSEDSREVAKAAVGRGSEDRAEGAALDRSQSGRRGRHFRLPSPYATAAGRLSLRFAADDSAPHAVFFA